MLLAAVGAGPGPRGGADRRRASRSRRRPGWTWTRCRLSPRRCWGPAWARLTKVFPFREDYARSGRRTPPSPAHGTTTSPPTPTTTSRWSTRASARPRTRGRRREPAGALGPDWYLAAMHRVRQPTTVLRAPLGLQAEPPGLYAPGVLEGWRPRRPAARGRRGAGREPLHDRDDPARRRPRRGRGPRGSGAAGLSRRGGLRGSPLRSRCGTAA